MGGGNSWRDRIGNNVWAFTLTVDEARGLVYMPVSGPGANFYGGDRPGDNLFGNSTVAIDIRTGELEWYFQNIHHELWDYNLPPAPGLFTIEKDGQQIPALAQVGKSAFMFILNRETGEPVHGVEERPVPAGNVPGEWYSPTQPIPLKPPPVARVSIGRDDIVTAADTDPQHAAACVELWDEVGYYNEGPYTPLRLQEEGTEPSLVFPGISGGVNWGGTAYDPELGYIFVNSKDLPLAGWMSENPEYGPDTEETQVPYVRASAPPFVAPLFDDNGTRLGTVPCFKPPWARLVAVNAGTGEIAWEVPLGINDLLPEGKQRVGSPGQGGPIVTAGGLTFIGATNDRMFRAFDSRTGEELWSAAFDYNVKAVPMTYGGSDGAQYLAVNVSAPATAEPRGNERLVVFALPNESSALSGQEAQSTEPRIPPLESADGLNITKTLAHHPALADAWGSFARYVFRDSTLPPRDRELLILRIGYLCGSEYEWGQHARIARRVGLSDDEIVRVTEGPGAAGWSSVDRALLRAADELHRDANISDRTWAELGTRYDTKQLMDVVFTVGEYNLVSMALKTFGVPLDEGVERFPR